MRGTILNALRVALRINSGKNIYNFGTPERLRTPRCSIFTGEVVTENGSCSAAFCESAALRDYPLRLTMFASSPLGEGGIAAGDDGRGTPGQASFPL